MKKVKFYIIALFILGFLSCEQNEVQKPSKPRVLKFHVNDEEVVSIENVVMSRGELISPDLRLMKAIHNETKEEVNIYVLTQSVQEKLSNARTERRRITTGYHWDGDHCWIYGTLVTDLDTGAQLFFPADTLTQLSGFAPICDGDDGYFALNQTRNSDYENS